MNLQEEIHKRLSKIFQKPEDNIELETLDNVHFLLTIVSEKFANKPRLERSRMVYSLLQDLIDDNQVHALNLNLKTNAEINGLK